MPDNPLSLPSQPVQIQTLGATYVRPGAVIEAVVLQSTSLLGKNGTQQGFRVEVQDSQGQRLVIKTADTIQVGAQVRLQIAAANTARLLQVLAQGAAPATSSPAPAGTTSAPAPGAALGAALTPPLPTPAQSTSTQASASAQRPELAPLIQNLRSVLPLQQPVARLIPLLVQIAQSPPPALPKPIVQQAQSLIRSLHSSEQLQQPRQLQQALQRSGTLSEALQQRLQTATLRADSQRATPESRGAQNPPAQTNDLKGQLKQLLYQVDRTVAQRTTSSTAAATTTAANPGTTPPLSGASLATGSDDRKLPPHLDMLNTVLKTGTQPARHQADSDDGNVDLLLRQLGKQILSALARTQMHQLETLAQRQPTDGTPAPTNSWVFELPIVHGKQVDSLKLQIEQREESRGDRQKKLTQWSVMLNFDLHTLGKLNVQLQLVQASLSARIWADHRAIHRQVKAHVNELKTNLEAIGMQVQTIDCIQGSPPVQNSQLYQRLVDVRT